MPEPQQNSWVVYILICADKTLYTGITNRIEQRINQHNLGKGARYTRGRGPVTLAYQEMVTDKSTALRRELSIKKLTRQQKWQLIKQENGDS